MKLQNRILIATLALASICFSAGFLGCNSGTVNSGGGGGTTQTAATPSISPAGGSYTTAQTITLTDSTSGAAIYYTTNDAIPSSAATLYTSPFTLSSTATVKAIAIATGYTNSAVASNSYTIAAATVATPTFSPTGGSFSGAQSVTLSDTTSGASIYYTTNGTTPTTSSTKYTVAIPVSATTTINAIGVATGYTNSSVATSTFTILQNMASTPTITPASGSFTAAQTVTLADATSGASIYYTTDGSTPTTSSSKYSAPFTVSASAVINAIAVASGYANSYTGSALYTFTGSVSPVSVYLTTHDQTNLLTKQATVNFAATTSEADSTTIVVDANQQYQSIDGFGASFTDSATYLLNEVATSNDQSSAMSDLFTRNGNGIGLNFMRTPIGSTDIARQLYTYDDQASGSTDLTLASFSIAHDETDMIPIIKKARALNPSLLLLASPWSPPAWMKDSSVMSPLTTMGGQLLMSTANEQAYANYFVKYLKAYAADGVTLDYLTIQNEPLYVTNTYPSMGISKENALTLLQSYVLPALSTAGLSTKVMVYDHNWDSPTYPQYILDALKSTSQMNQIAGVAWHGYGGTAGSQQNIQNLYPTLGAWMTEHSGGTWNSDQYTTDYLDLTAVLRNSGKAFVKWSLALNEKRGPDLVQNAGLGGCDTCTPLITVNSTSGAITKTIEYYTMGQFSRYVLPGAMRIYSNNTTGVISTAFLNPDGSTVLVAYNNLTTAQSFKVLWGSSLNFSYTLPAYGAATFVWAGAQTGTPLISATAQIQGSSFNAENGLAIEGTSDATGAYDLGYVGQGSYTAYNNIDFGTSGSITTVSVRTASGGQGGTATFYLDSKTSTPIATVTLPITGAWQTWQTASASVSSVSGVHTVYMVINGTTSSISNINWIQFK